MHRTRTIFATFGVCPRTLPARASEPWTFPILEVALRRKLGIRDEPRTTHERFARSNAAEPRPAGRPGRAVDRSIAARSLGRGPGTKSLTPRRTQRTLPELCLPPCSAAACVSPPSFHHGRWRPPPHQTQARAGGVALQRPGSLRRILRWSSRRGAAATPLPPLPLPHASFLVPLRSLHVHRRAHQARAAPGARGGGTARERLRLLRSARCAELLWPERVCLFDATLSETASASPLPCFSRLSSALIPPSSTSLCAHKKNRVHDGAPQAPPEGPPLAAGADGDAGLPAAPAAVPAPQGRRQLRRPHRATRPTGPEGGLTISAVAPL